MYGTVSEVRFTHRLEAVLGAAPDDGHSRSDSYCSITDLGIVTTE